MNTKQLLIAATLGTSGLLAQQVIDPSVARAQSTTAGAISGVVTDSKTGEKLAGVTIVVSSVALQGEQTAISDDSGYFKITPLPPGEYIVKFFYLEASLERSGISVGVNRVTPVYQKLSSDPEKGEVVKIEDTAPTIDPTSTTQGITIDKNYIKNIPLPGRTFEAALGAAAGSQNDGAGVSFSGSSSLENQYYVDGVNTTGLTFGTVGSPVINDFVEEIEVITGGYNAEFGRATGGVVNVVTKSGSNEIKGSIFGTYRPGQLTYGVERTPSNAASIDAKADNGYRADFGFEVGGPIVKDKLWFFVGFVPSFAGVNVTRTIKSRTDCRTVLSDGSLSDCDRANRNFQPDVDPETGFFITEDVDTTIRSGSTKAYNAIGKLNYALNPENQGQVSFQALPASVESPAIYGPETSGTKGSQLTTDLSGKWTSKFNDNKTEIEIVGGWHRDYINTKPFDDQFTDVPLQVLSGSSLGILGPSFGETTAVNAGCRDSDNPLSTDDPYPLVVNCPVDTVPYVIGGPGAITDDTEQRFAGKVNVTQRVTAAGNHEFKGGLDIEQNLRDKARLFSGGAFIQNDLRNDIVLTTRYVQLQGLKDSQQVMDNPSEQFMDTCNTPNPDAGGINPGAAGVLSYACNYLDSQDSGSRVKGNTFNWAAYLRDSWQIKPNFTINLGIRYEEQRLRYADTLANKRDPLTQEPLGKNAMVLNGNFAPRIGILYDWTKEGRSKIYGNFGRYFESIPMDINDRSFGGETTYQQQFNSAAAVCAPGMEDDPKIHGLNGEQCLGKSGAASEQLIGASGTLVAPGIKAQYLDEILAGAEYEIIDDLKIGVSYQNRRLGRVIEDVSTDGADTYIIANPGTFTDEEETKLMNRIGATDDPVEKARLSNQLALFKGIRGFDQPSRNYNALQFTATRRFSKKLYVQGSYTFSRTQGNYPGLISYDNGQIDPNISSQYDLIELLANRVGPLPQDRPHYIKLDGYYTMDFKSAGTLTLGTRVRALSGIPQQALAGHYLYGANESFLLPRGQIGRTDFEHGVDLHIGYAKKLTKGTTLEIYADLYNVYNRQGTAGVDDTYAPRTTSGGEQNANPISGGNYEDLIWVKAIDSNGGERADPIKRNPNFRNTNARYSPGYVQLGMRLTF